MLAVSGAEHHTFTLEPRDKAFVLPWSDTTAFHHRGTDSVLCLQTLSPRDSLEVTKDASLNLLASAPA